MSNWDEMNYGRLFENVDWCISVNEYIYERLLSRIKRFKKKAFLELKIRPENHWISKIKNKNRVLKPRYAQIFVTME